MQVTRVAAADLKPGDVMATWFGNHPIVDIKPYTGPFDWIVGIAVFPNAEMSLEGHQLYDVISSSRKS